MAVQHDLRWVDEAGRWPGLTSLVRVETTRYPAAVPAQVQAPRYCLSRQPGLSAEQALAAVRRHWAVENPLHWPLDVTWARRRTAYATNDRLKTSLWCAKWP